MLTDRSAPDDVFARVPELAAPTDPVSQRLDRRLDDDALDGQTRADVARRSPPTRCHGRHSTPGEVMLRLLLVEHLDNWRYRETGRRVADRLVLRRCCRVYCHRVPDATALSRRARTIQPATLAARNDRVVTLARRARATNGRTLRIDGTVGQTTVHHPTDSRLLVDGVRLLGRGLRRSQPLVRALVSGGRATFRSHPRTRRRGRQTVHRPRRRVGADQAEPRKAVSQTLLAAATAAVWQVARLRPARQDVHDARQPTATRLLRHLDRQLPLCAGSSPKPGGGCWTGSRCRHAGTW